MGGTVAADKKDNPREALSVMYIRHASSKYNLWLDLQNNKVPTEYWIQDEEELKELESITDNHDLRFFDAPLTRKGRTQANTLKYHSLPLKFVFVSQLRRALETCLLLFGQHPGKPHIIVHPLLRESMLWPNDVPSPLSEIERIYHPHGFDFALLKACPQPEYNFLYTLNNPDREALLKKAEKGVSQPFVEVFDAYRRQKRVEAPKHQRRVESFGNLRKRAKEFAVYLKEFLHKNQVTPAEIAVVSHQTFIGYSLATTFNEYGKAAIHIVPNCDFTYVDLNALIFALY